MFTCKATDRGHHGDTLQPLNALDAGLPSGLFAAGEQKGQVKFELRIVRRCLGQPLHTAASSLPSGGQLAQADVVLEANGALRLTATERQLILLDCLLEVARLMQQAGLVEYFWSVSRTQRDILRQQGRVWALGVERAQASQDVGRAASAFQVELDLRQAVEGARLVGLQAQQLRPSLGRTIVVTLRLPVKTLLEKRLGDRTLGPTHLAANAEQQAKGYCFFAGVHVSCHLSCTCPLFRNR